MCIRDSKSLKGRRRKCNEAHKRGVCTDRIEEKGNNRKERAMERLAGDIAVRIKRRTIQKHLDTSLNYMEICATSAIKVLLLFHIKENTQTF